MTYGCPRSPFNWIRSVWYWWFSLTPAHKKKKWRAISISVRKCFSTFTRSITLVNKYCLMGPGWPGPKFLNSTKLWISDCTSRMGDQMTYWYKRMHNKGLCYKGEKWILNLPVFLFLSSSLFSRPLLFSAGHYLLCSDFPGGKRAMYTTRMEWFSWSGFKSFG